MPVAQSEDPRFEARRAEMVEQHIAARGINDRRVLAAMAEVPRHRFVEASLVEAAYEDRPLPIGHGQTISQPFMVARATELASPQARDRALEVGAGCGYQVAVLARLCDRVWGIELLPDLAARANDTLSALDRFLRWQRGMARARPVRRHHRIGGCAAGSLAARRPIGRRRPVGDPGR